MNLVVDETIISKAAMMTERAKVITDTVLKTYFEQEVCGKEDHWKLAYTYKENAVLMDTVVDFLFDVQQLLNQALDQVEVK